MKKINYKGTGSSRNHPEGDLALSAVHLSFRDVEDLLAERGVTVSYETIRLLGLSLGTAALSQCENDARWRGGLIMKRATL